MVTQIGITFVCNKWWFLKCLFEGWIGEEDLEVFEQDVFDWKIVGVVGQDHNGSISSTVGFTGDEGCFTWDGSSLAEGFLTDVVWVIAFFEEGEHFLGLVMEVSVTAADAAQTKELRKGNACFGAVRVTGGKKKV